MPLFPRSMRHGRLGAGAALIGALLSLAGCGGTSTYALRASIHGLDVSGLTLSVDGTTQSVPAGATTQTLAPALASGASYVVVVATEPAAETCTVANGVGTIDNSDVTDVAVTCVANTYPVTGTITGLTSGGLVLLDNGTDATAIGVNAAQFIMPTPIPYGSPYSITIQSQPTGLTCSISGGAGTMGPAGTTVNVSCSTNTYTVGGTIAGLTASGLVLVDNGADAVAESANATHFTMPTPVAYGGAYLITVQSQPTSLVCTVSNGAGIVGAGAITNVAITCARNTTILHFFQGGSDGTDPLARLLQGADGNFYGITNTGGTYGDGTIFEMTPIGVESVLHAFSGTDGQNPQGGLIQDASGNFFGASVYGGSYGYGTAFELSANQTETVLHSFAKGSDGGYPICSLVEDASGNLYGTTWGGGLTHGIVFKIASGGSETVLHSFAYNSSDGGYPTAGLVLGSDGNYYGTTNTGGGSANAGTIFKITPSGSETLLYTFTGGSDGGNPQAPLIQGSDGNFYGTTSAGGAHGDGTVFQVTPAGVETVVYSFAGGTSDGSDPVAGLLHASDGNFYGTTKQGGSSGDGTVFKLTSDGLETVVYSFTGGSTDGAAPAASLIEGSDGKLYGTTSAGGPNGYGTVFSVTLR